MALAHESNMRVGNAISVGKCYKRVDEVKLAIDSYNKIAYTGFKKKPYKQCLHGKRCKSESPPSSKSSHNYKKHNTMCSTSCGARSKSERRGDEALQLTKAYISLLKELDNLENDSLKGIDKELVQHLKHANAELWQINNVLIKKKDEKEATSNNTPHNTASLSLDALEEFLGNLMVEAEEIEIEPTLRDNNKYKMIMPVLMRIGKMVSRHPTKQFLNYHEHLGKLEAAIRVGERSVVENNVCKTIENSESAIEYFTQDLDVETLSLLSQSVDRGGITSEDLQAQA